LFEDDNTSVRVDDPRVCFDRDALACVRVPFETNWNPGVHAAPTTTFVTARPELFRFANLDGHNFPLIGHARVEVKRGQWYECGTRAERVAVRKDRYHGICENGKISSSAALRNSGRTKAATGKKSLMSDLPSCLRARKIRLPVAKQPQETAETGQDRQ
jgi:hypothetical protein